MTKRELKELKLTERQLRYFVGRLAGKSKLQAALDAGYSRHSGCNAAYNIERRGRGGDPSIRKVLDFLERKQAGKIQASQILDMLDRQQGRNGAEAKSATKVQPHQ